MTKTTHRFLSLLCSAALLLTLLPAGAYAASSSNETAATPLLLDAGQPIDSGTCGSKLTWELTSNSTGYTLTLIGSGLTSTFTMSEVPWSKYAAMVTELILPEGLTYIGVGAFQGFTALTSLSLPSTLESIDQNAFRGCTGLTSLTLPEGVYNLYRNAFADCTGLTSVTLPATLGLLDGNVFSGCSNLTSIHLAAGNSTYCVVDGAIYNMSMTTLVAYPSGKIGAFTIPEGVERINQYAFQGCSGLTSVTIPSSITELYAQAFASCPNLSFIVFQGDAPMLLDNVFAGTTATCYYPAGNATWTEDVKQDYGGTVTWTVAPPSLRFPDVVQGAWYTGAVDFVVERGLMSGTGGDLFEPSRNIDRASFVSILYRMAGSPEVSGEHPFTDVKDGMWYSNAILWAYQNDVTSGTSATTFSPGATLTRQELVTLLQRFSNIMGWKLNAPQNVDLSSFPDGDTVSGWAVDSMNWACDMGLISGRSVGGETRLDPTGNAMRSEIASIFARFYTLIEN